MGGLSSGYTILINVVKRTGAVNIGRLLQGDRNGIHKAGKKEHSVCRVGSDKRQNQSNSVLAT